MDGADSHAGKENHPYLMGGSAVHFASYGSKQIDARVLERGALGDPETWKWRHFLCERKSVLLFAFDAAVDDFFNCLETLENPDVLAEEGEGGLGAGMEVVDVRGKDERLDVAVLSRQDHRIFGFIVDVGVQDAAADANETVT